jgi:cytochrome oxidase Cu insertion factor (SCO1/SenC/PrrC family)
MAAVLTFRMQRGQIAIYKIFLEIKFMNKTILATILALMVGCGGCYAELETDPPLSNDAEEDDRSWATWESCSQNIGDHPCDFTLTDQDGDEVSLYDFYGKTIVLDFSTGWCGYCQVAAQEVQGVQDLYGESDFAYITIMIETHSGSEPDEDYVSDWADAFEITTAPVLAGNRDMIDQDPALGWPVSAWPTFIFIKEDMTIHTELRGYSSQMILNLIEDTLNN